MASFDDEIIIKFHESVIRESDLNLLMQLEWLNDNIINFCLNYMLHETYPIHKDSIEFVSPELTQCIKVSDEGEIAIFAEPLKLAQKNMIFLPVNNCDRNDDSGGSHWSLLFYLRQKNTFFHYDSSLWTVNDDHARTLYERLFTFLDCFEMPRFYHEECPAQSNSYDCGIHVICTIEYLCEKHTKGIRQNAFEYCNNEKLTGKREWLRNLIMSLSREG